MSKKKVSKAGTVNSAKNSNVSAKHATQTDSSADHHHHQHEPFSFHPSAKDAMMGAKSFKFPAFDNFLKSDMVDDVKTGMNNCVNATECSISNAVDASNAATYMMEDLLSNFSKMVSNATEQHIRLGQELLKCKDAQDMVAFHKSVFEQSFHNMMDFYTHFTHTVQNFSLKHMNITSEYFDKNVRCFTTR